jgi:hypothetical protein
MATPEPTTGMTPLDYLKQADREMAAGNGRKAAALLWKATETIFLQLAKKRSLDLDELTRDYMDRIDPVWKRRFESWPAPMDYSDQVDPAWNLDLSLPSGDLIPLAKALETDDSVPALYYSGYLTAASLLHDHALMDVLEDYQLDSACKETRKFVMKFQDDPH